MNQATIKKSFTVKGIGLHTGSAVKIVFKPLPAGSGIMLSDGFKKYRLSVDMVKETNRGTVIKYGNNVLHTVEHMLSAVKALGIDNLEITAQGPEAPILDGSARGYALALRSAGILSQKKAKKIFNLKKPVLVSEGGKYMAALPGKGFRLYYFSDFSRQGLKPEEAGVKLSREAFIKEISCARTFGFRREIYALKKAGLIKGASLKNAIVIDKGRPLNGKLRFKNELSRHKVLDMIGDFSFIEGEINMTVIAHKTGHAENIKMVRLILKS